MSHESDEKLSNLTFDTPITSRDTVAQLTELTGDDDKGLLKNLPQLDGFKGSIILKRGHSLNGSAFVTVKGTEGGADKFTLGLSLGAVADEKSGAVRFKYSVMGGLEDEIK